MAINDERDDYRRDTDPARGRPRAYGRERGPRSDDRETPYRDNSRARTHSNVSSVVRDVDRLAYSLTRAGARAYFGTVGAIGDLVVNLADSLYAAPQGYSGRDRNRDASYEPERDGGRLQPRDRVERDRDRADRGGRSQRAGGYDTGQSLSSDISGNLRQAIRDTADVWSDSVREFSDVFHDEQERDDEIDARVAAAEDDASSARGAPGSGPGPGPDRNRQRTRPAAPPEPPPEGGERP